MKNIITLDWLKKEQALKEVREEAIRKCAEISRTEEVPSKDDAPSLTEFDPVDVVISTVKATKKSIEERILSILNKQTEDGKKI